MHSLKPGWVLLTELFSLKTWISTTNKNLCSKPLSMGNKEKRTLEEILNSLDEKQRRTNQNIQLLIKSIVPESVQIIRHGNITYVLDGKDFVWLTQANDHIDVEFARGASLDSSMLKDHGIKEKNSVIRHIEVRSFEKYQPELSRLLHDAARINFENPPKPMP